MYADDNKLYGPLASLKNAQKSQNDLDDLTNWSEERGYCISNFNVGK